MTLQERCQAGEAKLERVSNALLDPRPEILDLCEANLQEVITLLAGELPRILSSAQLFPTARELSFGSVIVSGCWRCRCKMPSTCAKAGSSWVRAKATPIKEDRLCRSASRWPATRSNSPWAYLQI